MRRKCNKCGKTRKCSKHNDQCKNGIRPLCNKCNRAQAKDWYEINRERKLEYMRNYYYSISAYR